MPGPQATPRPAATDPIPPPPAGPGTSTRAWWLAIAALGLPALLLPLVNLQAADAVWPDWARQLALAPHAGWPQPPWRWWTAAWLHGSPAHLWRNLLALLLIGWLGQRWQATPRLTLTLVLAVWPLTQVGMLAQASLHHYIGLSGVLHGAAALLLLTRLLDARRSEPAWAVGLGLAGLLVKVLMENPWQMALVPDPRSAINVAPWAHFCGAAAGLAAGCWLGWRQKSPS